MGVGTLTKTFGQAIYLLLGHYYDLRYVLKEKEVPALADLAH